MTQRPTLEKCPFCDRTPTLEDHRLIWCVRCECGCTILGERAPEPHGDGESSDEVQNAQAQKMSDETDWAHFKQTAIDAWNKRVPSAGELHWRSNHASVVAKSRVLIERIDMPVERVKAYKYITHLEHTIHNLETELNRLTKRDT